MVGDTDKIRWYDDMGESALAAVEKQIKDEEMLYGIWEKIVHKEGLEVTDEKTKI